MVEMMWQPKNHEISNPAPGVFPKLSWVVWTHFWWFRVHIWAQNWAQTRKIRNYLKIRPNEMWWKKCLLIIKNAWDFGYLRDFPREFEWRIENWHFWKFFFDKVGSAFLGTLGGLERTRRRISGPANLKSYFFDPTNYQKKIWSVSCEIERFLFLAHFHRSEP